MNRPHLFICLIVTLAMLCTNRNAQAQLFVFTSGSAYDSASYSNAVVTFNGSVSNQASFTSYGTSFPIGGVDFQVAGAATESVVGPGYFTSVIAPSGDATAYLEVGGSTPNSTAPISLSTILPSATTAVGTEIGGQTIAEPLTFTVDLADGTSGSFTYNAPNAHTDGLGYVGFVSAGSAITSIAVASSTIDPGDANTIEFILDNFTYGTANPSGFDSGTNVPIIELPEPTTLAMLALSVAGLLLLWQRRVAA